MITFVNVSKYFHGPRGAPKVVLNRANLRVDPYERVGILAPAGAGKTTIARLLTGAIRPSGGTVTRGARISWPLAYAAALHPALSPQENCHITARLYNLDPIDLALRVDAFAELGAAFSAPVAGLSPADRLRLAIALSLSVSFDVYIADEFPTVAVPGFQDKVEAALETRLATAGLILLTRHTRTIDRLTDRTIALAQGRLIDCTCTEEASLVLDLAEEIRLADRKEEPHAAA